MDNKEGRRERSRSPAKRRSRSSSSSSSSRPKRKAGGGGGSFGGGSGGGAREPVVKVGVFLEIEQQEQQLGRPLTPQERDAAFRNHARKQQGLPPLPPGSTGGKGKGGGKDKGKGKGKW
mmetsp:Transcript_105431/g.145808  ORF Transcript_105431/g.145808 Transcript_105431/m.145808 type:complete len:119 (-) Transcript_105431:323-679(-)